VPTAQQALDFLVVAAAHICTGQRRIANCRLDADPE
jgi:hypothetical protein